METWKSRAIEDIKAYVQGVEAEQITLDDLKWVEHQLTKINSGHKDSEPVKGGSNHREDRLCDLLDRKEALLDELNTGRQHRMIMKRCLDLMDEEEQIILKAMCCAEYGDGTSKRLAMQLNTDDSCIYRKWHRALAHYRRIKSGCPIK